jgi:hypothetical protein
LAEFRLAEFRLAEFRLAEFRLAEFRSAFLAPAAGSSVAGRFGWIFFSSAILVAPSSFRGLDGVPLDPCIFARTAAGRWYRGHNRAVLFITCRWVLDVTHPM